MKKIQNRLWAKLLAGVLLVAFTLSLAASGAACFLLAEEGVFSGGETRLLGDRFYTMPSFQNAMADARDYLYAVRTHQEYPDSYDPQWEESYLARFAPENSNFYFAVFDEEGTVVFSAGEGSVVTDGVTDYEASRYLCQSTQHMEETTNERHVEGSVSFRSTASADTYYSDMLEKEGIRDFTFENLRETDGLVRADVSYVEYTSVTYVLVGFVRGELTANDAIAREYRLVSWCVDNRVLLLALAVLSAFGALAAFIFLMCAAGHSAAHEGIRLTWFDRIPLDLLTAVWVCVGVLFCYIGTEGFGVFSSRDTRLLAGVVFAVLAIVLVLALTLSLLMSFAARCKAGKWYQNTVIFRAFRLCWRFLCWLGRGARWFARNLPLYWRTGFAFAGLCVVEFFALAALSNNQGALLVWWLLSRLALAAVLAVAAVSMRRLEAGGEKLAAGELSEQVDTRHMLWLFRRHAENLNAIGGGMQKAVEQQTRSERMKTELITNVSHDIKTPLTSIVNYVDLMKKENIEPEKAREYLEVLDRQSARLKKLTEDLVEASKASTGNLSCTLEATDVALLLGQVMGEYQERLSAAQLELVAQLAPDCPRIRADGRLLWRVFDNLLSNVCKYAMPGTRVYLCAEETDGSVVICFKNISRSSLNVSADELMERFVRGDSSRSTEGSGLGLSIAQSLTTLQRGEFALHIDGDLFKASVRFEALD